MNFDETTSSSQNLLKFLEIVRETNLVFNILIMVNQGDLSSAESTYVNQNQVRIKKFGMTRLRALELLNQLLSLLFPTFGVMAAAQCKITGNEMPECPHPDLHLSKYINTITRR